MHGESQNLMTKGSIGGHLLRFALPLFVGDLFQQLYNTADAIIVGNLIGNTALAAVSATSMLVFLRVSFLVVLTPVFRSIAVVNWVYPLTRFISTAFLGIYFFKADWIHAFERAKESFV